MIRSPSTVVSVSSSPKSEPESHMSSRSLQCDPISSGDRSSIRRSSSNKSSCVCVYMRKMVTIIYPQSTQKIKEYKTTTTNRFSTGVSILFLSLTASLTQYEINGISIIIYAGQVCVFDCGVVYARRLVVTFSDNLYALGHAKMAHHKSKSDAASDSHHLAHIFKKHGRFVIIHFGFFLLRCPLSRVFVWGYIYIYKFFFVILKSGMPARQAHRERQSTMLDIWEFF